MKVWARAKPRGIQETFYARSARDRRRGPFRGADSPTRFAPLCPAGSIVPRMTPTTPTPVAKRSALVRKLDWGDGAVGGSPSAAVRRRSFFLGTKAPAQPGAFVLAFAAPTRRDRPWRKMKSRTVNFFPARRDERVWGAAARPVSWLRETEMRDAFATFPGFPRFTSTQRQAANSIAPRAPSAAMRLFPGPIR